MTPSPYCLISATVAPYADSILSQTARVNHLSHVARLPRLRPLPPTKDARTRDFDRPRAHAPRTRPHASACTPDANARVPIDRSTASHVSRVVRRVRAFAAAAAAMRPRTPLARVARVLARAGARANGGGVRNATDAEATSAAALAIPTAHPRAGTPRAAVDARSNRPHADARGRG